MKKYVVGFLAGLLVASAFPAYGAVSSMIGKKVQVEYPITLDGESLDVKALAIDGTSYTPNRALADALGLEIKFENKTVIINKKEIPTGGETVSPEATPGTNEYTLESINQAIADVQAVINIHEQNIRVFEGSGGNPEKVEELKEWLKPKYAELERLKTIKVELEAQEAP